MSRSRIQIIPHLDYAELIRRCETCQSSKTKSYWLAIQLLSRLEEPMTVDQVAETVGFSADWVRKLVHRYNRLGPIALTDSYQRHNRKKPLFSPSDSHQIEPPIP